MLGANETALIMAIRELLLEFCVRSNEEKAAKRSKCKQKILLKNQRDNFHIDLSGRRNDIFPLELQKDWSMLTLQRIKFNTTRLFHISKGKTPFFAKAKFYIQVIRLQLGIEMPHKPYTRVLHGKSFANSPETPKYWSFQTQLVVMWGFGLQMWLLFLLELCNWGRSRFFLHLLGATFGLAFSCPKHWQLQQLCQAHKQFFLCFCQLSAEKYVGNTLFFKNSQFPNRSRNQIDFFTTLFWDVGLKIRKVSFKSPKSFTFSSLVQSVK